MERWQAIVDEMNKVYKASPLGKSDPQDPRIFYIKVIEMMTDPANDQKKLRALFFAVQQRMEREVRGEGAFLRLTNARLLEAIYQLTQGKITAAGGMAAWDALPAHKHAARSSSLHAELCQSYGQEEFDVLSQAEKDEIDFFLGGGCCMHKDLNAHKGLFSHRAGSQINLCPRWR